MDYNLPFWCLDVYKDSKVLVVEGEMMVKRRTLELGFFPVSVWIFMLGKLGVSADRNGGKL